MFGLGGIVSGLAGGVGTALQQPPNMSSAKQSTTQWSGGNLNLSGALPKDIKDLAQIVFSQPAYNGMSAISGNTNYNSSIAQTKNNTMLYMGLAAAAAAIIAIKH